MNRTAISIAIPTLNRGHVLLETIRMLLEHGEGDEILVVDQTPAHTSEIEGRLTKWNEEGRIHWVKLDEPSIPHAMNVGLHAAASEVVLFLDDDIVPGKGLAVAHLANYADADVVAVVGQVIQPWQKPEDIARPRRRKGIWEDLDFPFHSTRRATVRNVMAGNLSVRREAALAAGGFDERFIGASYRFETEFCRRLTRASGKIVFDPLASLRHLKVGSGGTRIYGDGVTSASVAHGVGNYYFCLCESRGLEAIRFIVYSFLRNVFSRHYLAHPWKIPAYLRCQAASLRLAWRILREKQKEQCAELEARSNIAKSVP